ncbi:MAG: hypothetical protein PHU71_06515 [Candidatus Gracilibacteria bacterium]|nr:hypothetical protein [Candidatus Gracilibacteria bacterium]
MFYAARNHSCIYCDDVTTLYVFDTKEDRDKWINVELNNNNSLSKDSYDDDFINQYPISKEEFDRIRNEEPTDYQGTYFFTKSDGHILFHLGVEYFYIGDDVYCSKIDNLIVNNPEVGIRYRNAARFYCTKASWPSSPAAKGV